jgi:hypothetical protein
MGIRWEAQYGARRSISLPHRRPDPNTMVLAELLARVEDAADEIALPPLWRVRLLDALRFGAYYRLTGEAPPQADTGDDE